MTSNSPLNPAPSEQLQWQKIVKDLQSIADRREHADALTHKINKVHTKLGIFLERKEDGIKENFSFNAAEKLRALYADTTEKLDKERSVLQRAIDGIELLLRTREENEQARRKRKAEEKIEGFNSHQYAKKSKNAPHEETGGIAAGTKVSAKVGDVWILAELVRSDIIKGKYEIEDMEADEKTGIRARHLVPISGVLAIVERLSKPDFPVGTSVLGLYPDTSCFYKGIIAPPPTMNESPYYYIIFEDDDGLGKPVLRQYVLPYRD